jgi:hypothetical protein
MSTAIRLVNGLEDVSKDCSDVREGSRSRHDEVRWTTKQVIAACLWSALLGLGCGYGRLFLHMGYVGCR